MTDTATCKICGHESKFVFTALVLQKYSVKYFQCSRCDFLQTEEPFWLTEAYSQPINKYDTGVLARNYEFSVIVSTILFFFFDHQKTFLDYGGGYGIFTRFMRDVGFDFRHYDPMAQNLLAQGFEYSEDVHHIELVTALECFEHFSEPRQEIEKILSFSRNIFFSTELLPSPIPERSWWYYAFNHGQHIAFYSKKTLDFLAQTYGLQFVSFGHFHLLTHKNVNPFLLHFVVRNRHRGLYWLVKKIMKSKTLSDFEFIMKISS